MRKIGNYGDIERQEEQLGVLTKLFSEAKNVEEIEALFHTILTNSEKAAISQRLAILRMVNKDFKYSDIESKLKVSSSTITKAIDGYLKHGQYNKIFNEQLDRFRFEKKKVKVKYPNRGKIEGFSPSIKQLQREINHKPSKHNYS